MTTPQFKNTSVNLINILRACFPYKSALRSFSLVTFCLRNLHVLAKGYWQKRVRRFDPRVEELFGLRNADIERLFLNSRVFNPTRWPGTHYRREPLNVITLEQTKRDYINRILTHINGFYQVIFVNGTLKCDHIKRLITLISDFIKRLSLFS